jgi:hypothetical protein
MTTVQVFLGPEESLSRPPLEGYPGRRNLGVRLDLIAHTANVIDLTNWRA